MRYSVAIAIVLLMACALSACNDTPAGTSTMKGTFTLITVLTDQDGNRLADNSGVTATLEGVNRSGVSDADGFIIFTDLPAGTYDITLTKPGYSTFKVYGSPFVGGGTGYLRDLYLTEIPLYTTDNFQARIDSNSSYGTDYVTIAGNVSAPAPETNGRIIRVFFDTSSAVSPTKNLGSGTVAIQAGHTDFQRLIPVDALRKAGVAPGTKVYVVGFPASVYTVGYFNPNNRQWVEANLSLIPSATVSFLMP